MKKILLAITCSIFIFTHIKAQSVSLVQLQEKAKAYSPQAATLPLIHQATEWSMKQLNGSNLPQLSLGGQASWQSDVTSLPISLPNIEIAPPPQDQYKFTLDLNQNIWDGGITAGQKKIALANAKVEEQNLAVSLYTINEQVNSLFFGALLGKKQLINLDLIKQDLNSKIKQAEAGLANGIIVKSDLLALKAKGIELNQQGNEILSMQNAAFRALSLLTGEQISSELELIEPVLIDVDFNQNSRPELELFSMQDQTLLASETVVRAKSLPKIALFATGGYGRPGLNFLSNTFDTYFLGGVQLKVPLSQLYNQSTKADLEQIKINRLKLDQQKKNFELMTDVKAQSIMEEIDRIKKLLIADNELITLRKEIGVTAEAQFSNGVITASDYLEKSNDEKMAIEMKTLHEVQLLQSQQKLKNVLGQ